MTTVRSSGVAPFFLDTATPAEQSGFRRRTRCARRASRLRVRSAFTLVEMLVVMGIMGVLVAALIPSLRSARGQMRMLMCASNLRTMSMDFRLFAEGLSEGGQGRSDALGKNQFMIDDFQARLYGTGEFWDAAGESVVTLRAGKDLMLCPAGPKTLTKTSQKPFGPDAVGPPENVSIGLNSRLYRAVEKNAQGVNVLAPKNKTRVSPIILSHPYVPLLLDVDGREAVQRGVSPFYVAPRARRDDDDPYASEQLWFPSTRHRGGTNVAFVGGHVEFSIKPARETWDWGYQPTPR